MKHHRVIPALLAAILACGAGVASATTAAAHDKHVKAKEGTTTIHRQRGADGLTDAQITRPNGGVTTVDRSRGADGLVDKTATGPRGGTTTADRSRNPDGTVDTTITRASP